MRYTPSEHKTPLGPGHLTVEPAVEDLGLMELIREHASTIRARVISPHELRTPYLPNARFTAYAQPRGARFFLVIDPEGAFLCDPEGRVMDDLPGLEGLRSGAPHVLVGALDGGRFIATDLLERPDLSFPSRLTVARGLIGVRPGIAVAAGHELEAPEEVQQLYTEIVEGQGAEALALRTGAQIYLARPSQTLNVVVMGFTQREVGEAAVGALCVGLRRGDGRYQIMGRCERMSAAARATLYKRLAPLAVEADFNQASSTGAVYQMVRPEVQVQLRIREARLREGPRPSARFDGAWRGAGLAPCLHLSGATFMRICEGGSDAGMAQLDEALREALEAAPRPELPQSEVLRREVYAKTLGGQRAVRKLLMWRTHKEKLDPRFPAFVVHFTDYSPQRKEPLSRIVRLAPTLQDAQRECARLLDEHVKSDWVRQDLEEAPFRLE